MRLGTGNTQQKSKVDLDEVECYLSNMIYKVCTNLETLIFTDLEFANACCRTL